MGYALAVLLLLSVERYEFVLMVFPLWIFLVSVVILVGNLRNRPASDPA